MIKRLYLLFFLLPFLVGAQNYPAKPSNYVTDETGTLTQDQQTALNAKLKAFEDTTTNQIFVYMTASLNGQDLAQYSEEIFHNWKIGQKGKNNGVLIAIFKNDHKFRIQTGYGLEGALPDLLTKRIQDNDMRPLFKQGDYFGGISAGIELLAHYSSHEYDPKMFYEPAPLTSYWQSWAICYVANVLFFIWYIYNLQKKNKNKTARNLFFGSVAVLIAILPCVGAIILFIMTANTADLKGFSSSGSYSSFRGTNKRAESSSWSSSDYSSSSSSDFDGGGGGDSGGGGSSSDW